MALSLKADEQTISKVFGERKQYIIPPYQRPYSWKEDQCTELFFDLKESFEDFTNQNKDDGYFLGNIVIASSKEDKNKLEVIDGQQRLTTLTLLMRALTFFDKTNKKLRNAIWELDDRTDEPKEQRLATTVFEDKDSVFLQEALTLNLEDESIQIKKKDNQYKKNIVFFFHELKCFDEESIQEFVDFLLYEVSLLPIQTEGVSKDIARENALRIFETINDRGLPLSDSDIFKAKLFSMALDDKKDEQFIKEWKELDEECESIKYSIDEVFKIYTHIIRGQEERTSPEVKLRYFFTREKISPFNKKKYSEILEDIFFIIESVKLFKDVIQKPNEYGELTKWFQLIDEYSNQYPTLALFVYLYNNRDLEYEKIIDFCKNLVRYSYYLGSSSKIQFYIYSLIVKVSRDELVPYYPSDVKESDFEYFGRLKNGYALLSLYLDKEQNAIFPYVFDKIINSRDETNLDESWKDKDFSNYTNTLGNILVLDIPKKHNVLSKKIKFLEKSKTNEMKELTDKLYDWSYLEFDIRNKELLNRLIAFFKKPNEN